MHNYIVSFVLLNDLHKFNVLMQILLINVKILSSESNLLVEL